MAYTDFSFMRPGNGDGEEPKKKPLSENEKIAIAQSEREKMLEYMRHPSYKERLKKEMFVDSYSPNNPKNVQDLENEYTTRMKEISTIPISRGNFENIDKYYHGMYFMEESDDFPPQSGVTQFPSKLFPEGRKSPAYKLGAPHIVISEDEFSKNILTNPVAYAQVVGHELGHSSNRAIPGGDTFTSKNVPRTHIFKKLHEHAISPEADQRAAVSELLDDVNFMRMGKNYRKSVEELAAKRIGPEKARMIAETQERLQKERKELQKKYGRSYDPEKHGYPEPPEEWQDIQRPHISENLENNPAEVSTRMIGLRRLAAEKFGHNMNEDFDIKKYKDQIQNYFKQNDMIDEYEQLSRDLGLSDDQINEMMKYIAKSNNQPSVSRYTA
jgi:hypothetical protein